MLVAGLRQKPERLTIPALPAKRGYGDPRAAGETRLQSSISAESTMGIKSMLVRIHWIGQPLFNAALILCAFVGGILLIGLAQRTGWIRASSGAAEVNDQQVTAAEYTCPMHPQNRQSEPGNCPICRMKLVPTDTADAQTTHQHDHQHAGTHAADEPTSDHYICPMMCTPPTTQPGRCPVCAMDLVPATGGGRGDGKSVMIEPAARRLAGIQTAVAQYGSVSQSIRTVGSIAYDESKLATISAYVDGRIEKLFANYVGVPVKQDDDLALIYSPELYTAQTEYLTALQGGGLQRLGGSSNLAELAKQNLIERGLTEDQIDDLRRSGQARSRIRIRSPITGTVIDKFAVEGDYIETGDKMFRIADLSIVWLMLELYPDDAARIRFGQQVEAEVQSMPGDVFTGRVAFIDPTVDLTTRTVSVRVAMLNLDGKLKPGDYATARVYVAAVRQDRIYDPVLAGKYISPMHPQVIRDQPGDCPICGMDLIPTSQLGYTDEPLPESGVVSVPRDAVLMTGDNSVVYVEAEPGRFEIRRVTVGPLTEDHAVILSGIEAGESVATDGNFLIDSQMQLSGNASLIDPRRSGGERERGREGE